MHPIWEGTKIRKINSEPGDTHYDGATGSVVLVLGPVDLLPTDRHFTKRPNPRYGYMVIWDDTPGVEVFVADWQIERISEIM